MNRDQLEKEYEALWKELRKNGFQTQPKKEKGKYPDRLETNVYVGFGMVCSFIPLIELYRGTLTGEIVLVMSAATVVSLIVSLYFHYQEGRR